MCRQYSHLALSTTIILFLDCIQIIDSFTSMKCESITPSMKYDCIFQSKENNPCCFLSYLEHSTRVSKCFESQYQIADELIKTINNRTNSLPSNTGSIQVSCGMIFEQCATIEKPSQKADCNRVKIEIPYDCCLIVKPNGDKSCYPVDRNDIGGFAKEYQQRETLTEKPTIICQGKHINITSILSLFYLFFFGVMMIYL